jgi:hypothetical protein
MLFTDLSCSHFCPEDGGIRVPEMSGHYFNITWCHILRTYCLNFRERSVKLQATFTGTNQALERAGISFQWDTALQLTVHRTTP